MRVLIVEDEAIIALDLSELMREFGVEVVGVAGAEDEAVMLAIELRPDVILMDIRLRNFPFDNWDGVKAAARIQHHYSPKIVYVTALVNPETAARIWSSIVVTKPFTRESLRRVIFDVD